MRTGTPESLSAAAAAAALSFLGERAAGDCRTFGVSRRARPNVVVAAADDAEAEPAPLRLTEQANGNSPDFFSKPKI